MNHKKPVFIMIMVLITTTLACSIFGIGKQAHTVEQTAQALKTEVGGIVTAGGSLIITAQSLETQYPNVLGTVQSISTQGAPILSTIEAVATNNPGLVQTAQALVNQQIPSGEPPTDIPIYNQQQAENYFGSSQYIFYVSPSKYTDVLEFYKTEMPKNGWQYLEGDSHTYANAAQLNYYKDTRTATINLSINPLNNSAVVVISISSQ